MDASFLTAELPPWLSFVFDPWLGLGLFRLVLFRHVPSDGRSTFQDFRQVRVVEYPDVGMHLCHLELDAGVAVEYVGNVAARN